MSSQYPLVSIIVPIYNLESHMSKCIESILAQTYKNIEVILVDDGSADSSGAIADGFSERDSRVRVLHKENGGVTRARLDGVRASSGELVGFIDGDDYIEPDMYERLVKNISAYGSDISHCGYRMVLTGRTDFYYNSGELREQLGERGVYDLLDGGFVEPGLVNKLFRRELFDSLFASHMEATGIRVNEDLLMNFYLFSAAKKSVFEDFCPYHYLVRQGSACNTLKPHHYTDPERVGELIVNATENNGLLMPVAYRLYVRRIMATALQKDYPELAWDSKKKLKQLFRDKKLGSLPKREKYMSLGVAYCLPIYRAVRFVYDKITGVDKKYL